MRKQDNDLLDLIYGASLEPSFWVTIMERLADMTGGAGGWLAQLSAVDGSGCDAADPMSRVDPDWPRQYNDHFAQRNPLHQLGNAREYIRRWTPCILTDGDMIAKEELLRTEFYNDFWRPQDIHSALMVRLATRGVEVATLNISRPARRGEFSRLDIEFVQRLQPHLIRSFDLGQRIASTRAISSDLRIAMDRSQHGLFLLADNGRLLHVNRPGQALVAETDGLGLGGGRLSASNASDARQLHALIARAGAQDGEQRSGGSMALHTPSRRLPLSVTVAPIASERFGPFRSHHFIMVCVIDLQATVSVPEQQLRELFGLTAAEVRVALAVLRGLALREIADDFGVSPNTVHVHLTRIYEKTGVNRQSDLVALMMRAASAFPA